jgi:glucokinase
MPPPTSFSIGAARRVKKPVLAFDLGGSWFRFGLVAPNAHDVILLDKSHAHTVRNSEGSIRDAQARLIEYIVEGTRSADLCTDVSLAAVSIGAAVNMNSGHIVGSAPLWGAAACDIDLVGILSQLVPHLSWSVVNDVTALAMRLLMTAVPTSFDYAAALTISSGIAYRTIDLRSGHIPVDPDHGLQGEIGHLPADNFWRDHRLQARCDCGALNHVSSFASGRAIESLLDSMPEMAELTAPPVVSMPAEPSSQHTRIQDLTHAIRKGDPTALEFINFVTRPLARVLIYQTTLNPQVGLTVVSGGVPEGLGQPYLETLIGHLEDLGLYGVPTNDSTYFRRRITHGNPDGLDTLRGAAVFARGSSTRI